MDEVSRRIKMTQKKSVPETGTLKAAGKPYFP
jgi:hypothetical protein